MQPDQTQLRATPPTSPPPLIDVKAQETQEMIIASIRRHPVGLVIIYLQAIAAVAAIIILTAALASSFLGGLSGAAYSVLTLASILLLALLSFVLILATSIYRQSKLVLTDKGVIQTMQKGPFHRKVSRLSMPDIEDVTTEQKGILPTLFNYGTLHIETSGELKNFAFPYTPDPGKCANLVINARHRQS